ncbi:MAG TPA: type I-U CRISPR-associated protein Csx17 [Streptosporangiaceae bacterium]|nr:type I-U CRISPR-associated protein Csx17 [Streptosporangiaceae bacterium]
MTRHVLTGLRPEPLATYLAGLGLVRLIGHADAAATFAWSADGLVVATSVADIAQWLADEYVPTPVLSPWNGGSGFGAKDVEPKKRLARLTQDPSARFDDFRDAVRTADEVIRLGRSAGWISDDGKGDKQRVVQEFRNRCPEVLLPWIDACVVLAADRALFPPLLGTGGNDGRLDFSTTFHLQLLLVLASGSSRARSLALARDLLAGTETERLADAPVGQFDPAGAGGQRSSPFGAAVPLVNPWKYVLLVEGALLFASGASRRHQHAAGRAAMPFTVSYSPDGSVSGAEGEESRGEVWAPVWSRACTFAEIGQLFGEARAAWRGRPARRAVDFYAATRSLGVASGVSEFVRYGLQQRNGLAFVAVPLDRVQVVDKPEVRLAAKIEDWASWIPRGEASRTVGTALRRFERAHLIYARQGDPLSLRELLAALTSLEQAVGRSGRMRDQIPVRRPPSADEFLDVLLRESGLESPELRIAVGIASCAAGRSRSATRTMRQLLLPIDPGDPADRAHRDGRWRDAPVVPGFGVRPLRRVLADVLAWRSRTAAEDEAASEPGAPTFRGVPTFRRGIPVPAGDLHALAVDPGGAAGAPLDEAELDAWLRACLALDWRGAKWRQWTRPEPGGLVPALALLHPLAAGLAASDDSAAPRLALGPDWAVRLGAGQVRGVHIDAVRRLRQAGWDCVPVAPAAAHNGQSVPDQSDSGTAMAAALVPRCRGANAVLARFARKLADDQSAELTETPEHIEELS